jgi:DNA phosphorothioation-dependent restriction protein DptG
MNIAVYVYGVAISFVCVYLYMLMKDYKEQNFFLLKLNNKLTEEKQELETKNISLWQQVKQLSSLTDEQREELEKLLETKEIHEVAVGTKVSWVDRTGETEMGVVIDDSRVDGKLFVHLKRLNKKGKPSGAIFTILADKLTILN